MVTDILKLLRDERERFIFQGGSDYARSIADEIARLRRHKESYLERIKAVEAERDAAVKALEHILIECRNTGYGSAVVMERMIDRIEEVAWNCLGDDRAQEIFATKAAIDAARGGV